MDPTIRVDARVEVIAAYRMGKHGPICMPARMKYKNREINFTKLGMRHPTTQGKRMIHVFDVSDGQDDYRLEFDAEALTWTLVSVLGGQNAAAD